MMASIDDSPLGRGPQVGAVTGDAGALQGGDVLCLVRVDGLPVQILAGRRVAHSLHRQQGCAREQTVRGWGRERA